MNCSIHPEAAQDLADAATFYRQNGSARVASRFLEEFDRVANLLAENPGFGTPFDLPRRTYPMRIYPYSVVYKPTGEGIRVLAIRHQRRLPNHGQDRS